MLLDKQRLDIASASSLQDYRSSSAYELKTQRGTLVCEDLDQIAHQHDMLRMQVSSPAGRTHE